MDNLYANNPFVRLRIGIESSIAEIKDRADQLSDRAATDERKELTNALNLLIQNPVDRMRRELFCHPGMDFSDDVIETFVAKYGAAPPPPKLGKTPLLEELFQQLLGQPDPDPSGDPLETLAKQMTDFPLALEPLGELYRYLDFSLLADYASSLRGRVVEEMRVKARFEPFFDDGEIEDASKEVALDI